MAASEKWHYCRDRVEGQKLGQEGSKEVESWADLVSRNSLYLSWCGSSLIYWCPSAATASSAAGPGRHSGLD